MLVRIMYVSTETWVFITVSALVSFFSYCCMITLYFLLYLINLIEINNCIVFEKLHWSEPDFYYYLNAFKFVYINAKYIINMYIFFSISIEYIHYILIIW